MFSPLLHTSGTSLHCSMSVAALPVRHPSQPPSSPINYYYYFSVLTPDLGLSCVHYLSVLVTVSPPADCKNQVSF